MMFLFLFFQPQEAILTRAAAMETAAAAATTAACTSTEAGMTAADTGVMTRAEAVEEPPHTIVLRTPTDTAT